MKLNLLAIEGIEDKIQCVKFTFSIIKPSESLCLNPPSMQYVTVSNPECGCAGNPSGKNNFVSALKERIGCYSSGICLSKEEADRE